MKYKPERGNINPAINSNRNQFASTYHMLKKIVEVCPQDVWKEYFYGVPFWYHVYHCVFFVDYWFREDYNSNFVPLSDVGQGIPPEFEEEILQESFISKEDMKTYLDLLDKKVQVFFDGLQDSDLGRKIELEWENLTYADVMASQNRHVMYNIGYLNGILRSRHLEESDWWAYNEKDD